MERIVRLEVKRPVLRGSMNAYVSKEAGDIERVEGGFLLKRGLTTKSFVPDGNVIEATIEVAPPPKPEDKPDAKALLEMAAKKMAESAPKPKKKPRKK